MKRKFQYNDQENIRSILKLKIRNYGGQTAKVNRTYIYYNVKIVDNDNIVLDEVQRKVGIRKIELILKIKKYQHSNFE